MQPQKRKHPEEKSSLHPRNKHRLRYNFKELIRVDSDLKAFVKANNFGDQSIDFFDPKAVKALNKGLLRLHYNINYWDIPNGYLCPPIPGRADYIHNIADLVCDNTKGEIPKNIKCLDIGVGANCVYPIIGVASYGWAFIGADIDEKAVASALKIVESNPFLENNVRIKHQSSSRDFFKNVIDAGEKIDVSICNPPFHESLADAQKGSRRKLKNLKGEKSVTPKLNFGGQSNELWCDGGEERFVKNMIYQSRNYSKQCLWFSSLISKESNVRKMKKVLQKVDVLAVKVIPMGQGNKKSRILAWSFLTDKEQKSWKQKRNNNSKSSRVAP